MQGQFNRKQANQRDLALTIREQKRWINRKTSVRAMRRASHRAERQLNRFVCRLDLEDLDAIL